MHGNLADTLPEFIQESTPTVPTPPPAFLILCVDNSYYKRLPSGTGPTILCTACLHRRPSIEQSRYEHRVNHFLRIGRSDYNFTCHECGVNLGATRPWGKCHKCSVTYPQFIRLLARQYGKSLNDIVGSIKVCCDKNTESYVIHPRSVAVSLLTASSNLRRGMQASA